MRLHEAAIREYHTHAMTEFTSLTFVCTADEEFQGTPRSVQLLWDLKQAGVTIDALEQV
jgi:hypothetical protein